MLSAEGKNADERKAWVTLELGRQDAAQYTRRLLLNWRDKLADAERRAEVARQRCRLYSRLLAQAAGDHE